MKYIEMTLNEALTAKWAAGREKYGPIWHGNSIEELFEEQLDSIHYCDKAVEDGYDVAHMRPQLVARALELKAIWRMSEKKTVLEDNESKPLFCSCVECVRLRQGSPFCDSADVPPRSGGD